TILSRFSRSRTGTLFLQLTESHITDVPLPGGYAGQYEPLITIEESQLDNIAPDEERYRFDRAVIQPGFYFTLLKIRPGDKVSVAPGFLNVLCDCRRSIMKKVSAEVNDPGIRLK